MRKFLPSLMAALLLLLTFNLLPAQLTQGGNGGTPALSNEEEKEEESTCYLYESTISPQRVNGNPQKHTECSTNGLFCLTFMDLMENSGQGFDHPIKGSSRRQCAINAVNYLEEILVVPAGTSVEILMLSDAQNPNMPSNVLAGAAPYLPGGFGPGFHSGLMEQHLLTGLDPDPTRVDGEISFNFANGPWSEDCTVPVDPCGYDIQSVMLHEVTHLMGFASFIGVVGTDPTTGDEIFGSQYGNGQFSNFDNVCLFHHGASVNKVVTGNPPSITPALNDPDQLLNNQLYMTANPLPDNNPVFSISNYRPGSTFSHFVSIFNYTNQYAPQFHPFYVMNVSLRAGTDRREYVRQDMEILSLLGYTFSNSYPLTATLGNTPPQLVGTLISQNWWGPNAWYNLTPPSGIEGTYFQTDNCQSVLIDLNNMPGSGPVFNDPEGDPISVFPGTLHNYRGCGRGNDLTQLQLLAPDKILFTPREDFWGRAQFGFNLYDGIEKGAYVVITIDVEQNLSCFTPSTNLIMNGNLEEGSQRNTASNPNNIVKHTHRHFFQGRNIIDGQSIRSPGWADSHIRNTQACAVFGGSLSFDPGANYLPPNNDGDRYISAARGEDFYMQLNSEMGNCNTYRLEFDMHFGRPTGTGSNPGPGEVRTFEFAFAEEMYAANHFSSEAFSITNPLNDWFHVSYDFTYTGPDCRYIFLDFPDDIQQGGDYHCYDNFSLTNLNNPNLPQITTSVTGCGKIELSATVTGGQPPYTYDWSPAGPLSDPQSAITLGQITSPTTFAVKVTDANGCESLGLIQAFPEITVDLGPDAEVCFNPTFTLDAGNAGSSYLWSTGETTQTIDISQPGTYQVDVTSPNGCMASDEIVITEDPEPQGGISQLTNVGKIPCPGEPTDFKAFFSSDVIDYYWLDGNGNQIWNTQFVTLSYPVSGVYDIELHIFDGCHEVVYTIPFKVNPCCGAQSTSFSVGDITSSDFIANHNGGSDIVSAPINYIFDGVLTVDQTITFLNCPDLHFTDAGKIEILPGKILRVENSHLSGCENEMWQGIEIMDATAYLQFNSSTLIDATEGVTSTAGGDFNISNSTFDRNYIHLKFKPFNGTHSGILSNTQFLCTAPLVDLTIGDYTRFAIDVDGNSDLKLGSDYSSASKCIISGGYNGIHTFDSDVEVVNFDIANMVSGSTPEAGTGIFASEGPVSAFPTHLEVGGFGNNQEVNFTGMETGIRADGIDQLTVEDCEFKPIFDAAISMENMDQATAELKGNLIQAGSFGIHFVDNPGTQALISDNILDMTGSTSTGIAILTLNSSPGPVSILDNTLMIQKRGIALSQADGAVIHRNVVTVSQGAGDTKGIRIHLSDNCVLSDNQYTGLASQSSSVGYDIGKCQQTTITCNDATTSTTGYFIKGSTSNQDWRGNSAVSCGIGLHVRNGGIGTQGSSSETSGNVWSGNSQYDILHENVPVSSTEYWVDQQLSVSGIPSNQPPQVFTASLAPPYACNSTGKVQASGPGLGSGMLSAEALQQNWNLSPNPTSGDIFVSWTGMVVQGVRVMDLQGRILLTESLETSSAKHKIELDGLSAGVYFVEIQTADGQQLRKKVVKQ